MGILLRRPGPAALDSVLDRAMTDQVTYPERGATADEPLPVGYRHDRLELEVGRGSEAWDRARDGLRHWAAHANAGAEVTPAGAPLEPGMTVLTGLRLGPVFVLAPCRIITVADDADRFGFAYGTLPGHPECGEEAFYVHRAPDGVVRFSITAFSRPATPLIRLGAPVARRIQVRTTRLYLEGIRSYVAGAG